MAEAKREKRPVHKSPKGVAIFPYLNKPDTKWKPEGEFKTKQRIPTDEAEDLIAIIEKAQEEAKAEAMVKAKAKNKTKMVKAADLPFSAELDDSEEETGNTLFNFKSTASGTTKAGKAWSRKLALFDAKGKPFKKDIYGGSTLIIAFTAEPWVNPKFEYGVKLQMEAVQVIDLVSTGGGAVRSASAYGFGQEEGYEDSGEDESSDDEETSTDDSASDEADF
jgi:hypothetical protein